MGQPILSAVETPNSVSTNYNHYNSKGKVTKTVEYKWVAVKANSYLDKESEKNFMFDFNDLLLSERLWLNIEVEKPA
jgi:hypothetical protein